ncbi:MAG: PQQ-binding-like beta-propeller repeat protein [Rhodobacteraceae bacterium]|nr:PQQ-binding-like beta-propeller repeat protein [Paracoccaceae bacterium]
MLPRQLKRIAGVPVWALAGLAVLSGCSERERILKGERIDIRVPLERSAGLVSDPDSETVSYIDFLAFPNRSRPVALTDMRSYGVWPQLNGNAAHRIQHPAISPSPERIWSISVGRGNDRSHRITAAPVAAEGFIFALDSMSEVSAYGSQGKRVWSRSLVPPFEQTSDASGGGLAYENGALFVTTGFGYLYALRASTGEIIWSQKFEAPASNAPTIADGRVFVVTQDSQAWAIDSEFGRVLWRRRGTEAAATTPTGATPAIRGDLAIIPFPSGEVQAVEAESGQLRWTVSVGGKRQAAARSTLQAISGAPVIDNGVVYVANQSGKMSAIDIQSGVVLWTVSEGSASPVWPTGGSVFLVSDAAELVRLDASTGGHVWSVPLPEYKSRFLRRKKAVFTNFGPILAGGRLIVASGDGAIRFFDPTNGSLTGVIDLDGGAAAMPIVVSGTLYVVSDQGRLIAYR